MKKSVRLNKCRCIAKKHRLLLVAFLLIGFVFSGFVLLLYSPQKAGPMYQGKPLNYWLPIIERGTDNPFSYGTNGGSDAIPVLLKAVETRGNILQTACRATWSKFPIWVQKRWTRPVDAARVRTNAASLLAIVGDRDFHIKLLKTHPDPTVRLNAAHALGTDAYNEKATAALAHALVHDKDPRVRATVVEWGLNIYGHKAIIAVPALIQSLTDTSVEVRTNAAMTLILMYDDPGSISSISNAYNESPTEKKVATDRLSKAIKDNDIAVHDAAARWLWTIDRQNVPYYKRDWWK